MSMHDDVQEILFTEQQLKDRVAQLGREISRDYAGKEPVLLVSVLPVSYTHLDVYKRQAQAIPPGQRGGICLSTAGGFAIIL